MTTKNRIATLHRFWHALGEDVHAVNLTGLSPDPVPLPSKLAVADLAWASVTAAAGSASLLTTFPAQARTDPRRVALAFQSDRHLRLNGEAPTVWSPLSGFWQTSDGWVRTHGNYPHHARALLRALELGPHVSETPLAGALRERESAQVAAQISDAGGLCVAVQSEDTETDRLLRLKPIVELTKVTDSREQKPRQALADAPLRGIRVLDLTRVIAGPVATRTLAQLGADVLRLDPRHMSEFDWQHFDTGHGKRSALLDIATEPEQWQRLLAHSDVVVLGYRAEGLSKLGLDPHSLLQRHPDLVVARLTAWGKDAPRRRGFDSLVQAEAGISWIESDDDTRPGALPAQALDHSAGYLLAAGICAALRRRQREGGGWLVETSLRRIAAELLGMPRSTLPSQPEAFITQDDLQTFEVATTQLTTVRPAVQLWGGRDEFVAPRPWGRDMASWE